MLTQEQQRLVLNHLGLAKAIAREYRAPEVPREDLLGRAYLALVEAAATYPTPEAQQRDFTFAQDAATRIKWALADERRRWTAAKVDFKAKRKAALLRQTQGRLAGRLDRKPTDEEIAAELGWTADTVRRMRLYAVGMESALPNETPVPGGDEENVTYGDRIPDPLDLEEDVIDRMERTKERAWAVLAVDKLPPLMRATMSLRLGLPVPSLQRISMAEALRVAGGSSSNTVHAIRKLREVRRNERGDLPTVVPRLGGCSLYGRKAGTNAAAEARERRSEEFWRRLCDGWTPPGLERDERAGTVCAAE